MLDLDVWQEIASTVRENKMRTLLTGFSVAWGIFILVLLLGSGTGLARGIEYQFRDDAMNSIWVRSGQTSLPYRGLTPGRQVRFTNDDRSEVRRRVDDVEHLTARFYPRGELVVSYDNEASSFDIRSVHPDHLYLEKTRITEGRFLNQLDVAEYRKVAAIGREVRKVLFGDTPPIGRYINVNGVPFKVVGLFVDEGGVGEESKIYLPISTAQRTFSGGNQISMFMLTTGDASVKRTEAMSEEIRQLLAQRHHFDPEDRRAVFVSNVTEFFESYRNLISGIRAFVWVIGIGTLLAGVVGVSNVMMIAVRERTQEIGVRKALGATPRSVLALILQEALVITAAAGYVGLLAGVGLLEIAGTYLPDSEYFRDPSVDFKVALAAIALLMTAGTLAGAIPAWRAAHIRPVDALKDE